MIDIKLQKSVFYCSGFSGNTRRCCTRRSFTYLKLGFSAKMSAFIQAGLLLVKPMTDEPSTLYAKLLGETAVIEWKALERFWAKGDLIWVDASVDLIEVAQAMAENRAESVAVWRNAGTVAAVTSEQALDLQSRDPEIWAVVVSPFILIQTKKTS